MRKFQRVLWVGYAVVCGFALLPVSAGALATAPAMATPAGLSLAEIKITGDEFVVLQNNSGADIADLSSYWLQDFNNVNPLSSGVSNTSQQLPPVMLRTGQTLLLSSVTQATCGAAVAGKLNISLTDSGGFLQIVQMGQNAAGAVTQTSGDMVSWSSGANGSIQNVPSSTKDSKAVWYRYQSADKYPWQQADQDTTNACQLNVVMASGSSAQPISTASLSQAAGSPPATIISPAVDNASDTTSNSPTIPAADVNLLAPQLTELLPNPTGTGNDDTDEFVELYNPNTAAFDLSGFTLQVGTTTVHSYTFPSGSVLPGRKFTAFYSADTGLNLSNTSGQAVLLDPPGRVVSQTDSYVTAKDGFAWALANGSWYWTTQPTPSDANVISQPATSTKGSTKKTSGKTTKSAGKVKGASTASNSGGLSNVGAGSTTNAAQVIPIHPWMLALVCLTALLYGTYEYRTDLANYFHRSKANRAARRAAG